MTLDKNIDEHNELIKKQNQYLLTLQKEKTFEKFYGSLEEKNPYEAGRNVPLCDTYNFDSYNGVSLRHQSELIADIADKMKELKYFTSRTKRQYEYFKSLKETSNNLNPKILQFIEDYENFYFKEDK